MKLRHSIIQYLSIVSLFYGMVGSSAGLAAFLHNTPTDSQFAGISFKVGSDYFKQGFNGSNEMQGKGVLPLSAERTVIGSAGADMTSPVDFEFTNIEGVLAAYGVGAGFLSNPVSLRTWDSNTEKNLEAEFLKRYWEGTTDINTMITKVPIPAAIWMFIAGLTIIAGSQSCRGEQKP